MFVSLIYANNHDQGKLWLLINCYLFKLAHMLQCLLCLNFIVIFTHSSMKMHFIFITMFSTKRKIDYCNTLIGGI